MKNIGIVGRKRSGKDTAAQALVDKLGYVRHGLADPLKDAALKLDPYVHFSAQYALGTRLSEVVEWYGWEVAKDTFPEVRRVLQRLGDEAGRQVHGEMTWINQLLSRVELANAGGEPVVVPDVRYPNEADELRRHGFLVVRIERPGFCDPVPGEHASEQVERLTVDAVIRNTGTVAQLHEAILGLVD